MTSIAHKVKNVFVLIMPSSSKYRYGRRTEKTAKTTTQTNVQPSDTKNAVKVSLMYSPSFT